MLKITGFIGLSSEIMWSINHNYISSYVSSYYQKHEVWNKFINLKSWFEWQTEQRSDIENESEQKINQSELSINRVVV